MSPRTPVAAVGCLLAFGALASPAAAQSQNEALWSVGLDGSKNAIAAPVGFGAAIGAAWSPDSTRAAFITYKTDDGDHPGRLIVKAADGSGPEKRIATDVAFDDPDAAWSPTGDRIAYVDVNGDVRTVAPDGSHNERVAAAGGAVRLRWSPDGSSLVYSAPLERRCHGFHDYTYAIYTVAPGHHARRITSPALCDLTRTEADFYATWTDDDHVAFVRDHRDQTTSHELGSTLYVADVGGTLQRVPLPGGTNWSIFGGDLAVGPDHQTIAIEVNRFTVRSNGKLSFHDANDLWILRGKTATHLKLHAGEGGGPVFTPDGHVAECGYPGVFLYDDLGKRRLLARFDNCFLGPASPDGSHILVGAATAEGD
jgi:hypothetical protein